MRRHHIQNLNEADISAVTGGNSSENRVDYLKRTAPNFSTPKLHYPQLSPEGGLPKIRYKTSAERKNEPSECPPCPTKTGL